MARIGGKPGRQVKKKQEFRALVTAYCRKKGVDPFEFFADVIATDVSVNEDMDEYVKLEHRLTAAKELAQYMQPKLRHMELQTQPDEALDALVTLFQGLTPAKMRAAFQGAVNALNPVQTNGHAIAVPVDEEK